MNKDQIGRKAQQIMKILNATATSKQWEELTALLGRMTGNKEQLKLGDLIFLLKGCPRDKPVRTLEPDEDFDDISGCGTFIGKLTSYRGYYTDLAFSRVQGQEILKVDDVLEDCRKAIGTAFDGYKGGSHVMSTNTRVWVSQHYASSDQAVVDVIETDDCVYLVTEFKK